jgi:hypothetical protein
MVMSEPFYTIVVPALVLGPDRQSQAAIDIGHNPIDLPYGFCIDFWFKPIEYPSRPSQVGKIFTAYLENTEGAKRELVLWLHENSVFPELYFQGGEKIDVPPLQEWTRLSYTYKKGELNHTWWRGDAYASGGKGGFRDEGYRLTKLVFCAENLAQYAFAEIRLWNRAAIMHELGDYRYFLPSTYSSFAGYWSLDEGTGSLMVDKSEHGNDGMIHGAEWQLASGLIMRVAGIQAGGERVVSSKGKSALAPDAPRAKWVFPFPNEDQFISALDEVLKARQRLVQKRDNELQKLRQDLAKLEEKRNEEETRLTTKQHTLVEKEQEYLKIVNDKKADVEKEKAKVLANIASSQKLRLKDFIIRLQEDIALGRKKLREGYGGLYGLDSINLEVKMVPGVGGIGMHLPNPKDGVDPNRLSTLKLRFRASKVEEEAEGELATVPWLEDSTEGFAQRKLAEAGFRAEVVYQEVADATKAGRVLRLIYDAKNGNHAEPNSVVTVVVGRYQ